MDDPYKTLGVARDANQKAIHRAYLKLAKLHHPDLNPGNLASEERFKAISAANDLLSDPETRGKFDRGEIDAGGQEHAPRPSYRDFADGAAGERYSRQGRTSTAWGSDDLNDIFGSMFEERASTRRANGQDQLYALSVSFLDALNGATRRLTLETGAGFDVKIPAGTTEGQVLRLRGKGEPGRNGGEAGDVLIEVHVASHAYFNRDGQDLKIDLPVTFAEAILGAQVQVPTPTGPVLMRIPPNSNAGTILRLKGKGVPAHAGHGPGDLLARLLLVTGATDAALEAFLAGWAPEHPVNPRQAMEIAQ